MVKTLSDQDLVRLFKKGRYEAFEELLKRHSSKIYNFIFRFFKNQPLSEELEQEVFMKVYQKLDSYKDNMKFSTWIFSIARNLCIDEYRKRKIRKVISLEEHLTKRKFKDGDIFLADIPDPQAIHPENAYLLKEREYWMQRAVERLPLEQREIVELKERENLTFQEIAQVTGESINTVKSRMRYALLNLSKALQSFGVFDSLNIKTQGVYENGVPSV